MGAWKILGSFQSDDAVATVGFFASFTSGAASSKKSDLGIDPAGKSLGLILLCLIAPFLRRILATSKVACPAFSD